MYRSDVTFNLWSVTVPTTSWTWYGFMCCWNALVWNTAISMTSRSRAKVLWLACACMTVPSKDKYYKTSPPSFRLGQVWYDPHESAICNAKWTHASSTEVAASRTFQRMIMILNPKATQLQRYKTLRRRPGSLWLLVEDKSLGGHFLTAPHK